jgi:hypothetical protein
MRLKLLLPLVLAAAFSCTNSQALREDQRRISGIYLLKEIDGAALPASLPPEQGCNREVRNGNLELFQSGVDAGATYTWSVAIMADCTPIPPGVAQGTSDYGFWDYGSVELSFRSKRDFGNYNPGLEEKSGLPPAVTIAYLGNSYRFVLAQRWDAPTGVVFVKFVDQAGQPVSGVVLTFEFPNGLSGGGQTPESGEFGTRGAVGDWAIAVVPPAGYAVPASQANPFSVSVAKDDAQRLQVSLVKN